MTRWIVQKFVPQQAPSSLRASVVRVWQDVRPTPTDRSVLDIDSTWEAETPGDAFHQAVLSNEDERMEATSYRVLPYLGGATFNMSLNVEAAEHGS